MVKIFRRLAGVPRRIALVLALLVVSLAALTVAPVAPSASAAGANCAHHYPYTDIYMNGYYTQAGTYKVANWSSCHDINIDYVGYNGMALCGTFRVRFYPSSGSSYTNSWKYVCPYKNGPSVLASWVNNGTTYRIESTDSYSVGIFD